jgi:hypothetical protein
VEESRDLRPFRSVLFDGVSPELGASRLHGRMTGAAVSKAPGKRVDGG